jgi:hypothetical protein
MLKNNFKQPWNGEILKPSFMGYHLNEILKGAHQTIKNKDSNL